MRAWMRRIVNVLGMLNRGEGTYAVFLLCATIAIALPAQTFTALFSFDGKDGSKPVAGLVQAANGDFYGTTVYGGTNGYGGGTVFKMTPDGKLTTLYSFCSEGVFPDCTDGEDPNGLVQATNGDFYGTTSSGGAYGGGAECYAARCGTIFKITPSGTLTTLYSFCSQGGSLCTDGESPQAALVQATNGDLYGTTNWGGANGYGTVFKITTRGTLTTLYSFCAQANCTDGAIPNGLVTATNGDLYGTTAAGGASAVSCFADASGCGTVFEITPAGTLTTLYSFCAQSGCADGQDPIGALVLATDGNFYGTTVGGGAYGGGFLCSDPGCGTVFKITPSGTLTTLYSFCSQGGPLCTDGDDPNGGLIQATNGDFYGTTYGGGADCHHAGGCGTVFSLSVGLGPVAETLPTRGKVGAPATTQRTNPTGSTSVTFNGTADAFIARSTGSAISTTAPTSAATGPAQVVTPSGTLSSKLPFPLP